MKALAVSGLSSSGVGEKGSMQETILGLLTWLFNVKVHSWNKRSYHAVGVNAELRYSSSYTPAVFKPSARGVCLLEVIPLFPIRIKLDMALKALRLPQGMICFTTEAFMSLRRKFCLL